MRVQHSISRSGAPLAKRKSPSGIRMSTDIRLRSESKGRSPRRRPSSRPSPALAPAISRAASVGSPSVRQVFFGPGAREASFASTKAVSSSPSSAESSSVCRPSRRKVPVRLRPSPVTDREPFGVHSDRTVIRFSVRVPVLSVQMTSALPRVSTVWRPLTSEPRLRIRRTASASDTVTMAGSPSGTAATASEIPVTSIAKGLSPRSTPSTATAAQITRQPAAMVLPRWSSRRASGVGSGSMVSSIPAMRPISVSIPVAVTRAVQLPLTTIVPMRTMFSPAGTRSTGTDSPVSSDSSQETPPSSSSASAGTRSPAAKRITSPGTASAAGISRRAPSRNTFAVGAASRERASSVRSVRTSCKKPMRALRRTMASMASASRPSPSTAEIPAQPMRISVI